MGLWDWSSGGFKGVFCLGWLADFLRHLDGGWMDGRMDIRLLDE